MSRERRKKLRCCSAQVDQMPVAPPASFSLHLALSRPHLSLSRPHLCLPGSCPALSLPAAHPDDSDLMTHVSTPMLTLRPLPPRPEVLPRLWIIILDSISLCCCYGPLRGMGPLLPFPILAQPGQHHWPILSLI